MNAHNPVSGFAGIRARPFHGPAPGRARNLSKATLRPYCTGKRMADAPQDGLPRRQSRRPHDLSNTAGYLSFPSKRPLAPQFHWRGMCLLQKERRAVTLDDLDAVVIALQKACTISDTMRRILDVELPHQSTPMHLYRPVRDILSGSRFSREVCGHGPDCARLRVPAG